MIIIKGPSEFLTEEVTLSKQRPILIHIEMHDCAQSL